MQADKVPSAPRTGLRPTTALCSRANLRNLQADKVPSAPRTGLRPTTALCSRANLRNLQADKVPSAPRTGLRPTTLYNFEYMLNLIDNKKVKEFEQVVERSARVVLTCHVRPDGDAIGSTLGLAHLLRSFEKSVTVVVPDRPPRSLAFLPGFKDIAIYTRHDPYVTRVMSEADLLIGCDFNKLSRLDQMADLFADAKCFKVLIDHHQGPDDFCDLTISYPEMSSTCELLFRVIAAMGLYPDLNVEAATCILTGIVTDTRNFTVNCKNPDIYEVLARLMEKGADKTKIVKEALLTQSFWSVKLQAYAIAEHLELFDDGKLALVSLNADELERFHYERGDTEGLVNTALNIRGVRAAFFLRQDEDGVKVSARSEAPFNVAEICEKLAGGGGHLQAAGAEYRGSLEDCRRDLLNILGVKETPAAENVKDD